MKDVKRMREGWTQDFRRMGAKDVALLYYRNAVSLNCILAINLTSHNTRMLIKLAVLLAGATAVLAVPAVSHPDLTIDSYTTAEDISHNVVTDQAMNTTLDYVKNSGVCETTPGVNQYSGYLDIGDGNQMFFWYFEARNNPSTAPLSTWFNGGPGCSSMIGLFQENGPCQFYNGSSEPSLNKYSFNTNVNMLYVDQPIGSFKS